MARAAEKYDQLVQLLNAAEPLTREDFVAAKVKRSKEKYPPERRGLPYIRVYMLSLLEARGLSCKARASSGSHFVVGKSVSPSHEEKEYSGHRVSLNASFIRLVGLSELLPHKKMEITWVASYVAQVFPDKARVGWESFDCSHRCIQEGLGKYQTCVDPVCMVWESKRVNQWRGFSRVSCMSLCRHCSLTLCECASVHVPKCL